MAKYEAPALTVTPKGEVVGFCAIQKAATNYVADGVYEFTLAFKPAEIAPLLNELERLQDTEFKSVLAANPKFKRLLSKVEIGKPELDDEGEETGRVLLKFRQKAVIRYKDRKTGEEKTFEKRIAVKDAKGTNITKDLNIGEGSILRVSFEPAAYTSQKDKEVGVTLRPAGVMIFALTKFVGNNKGPSAADLGFETEDDGFSLDDETDDDQTDGGDADLDDDDEIPF